MTSDMQPANAESDRDRWDAKYRGPLGGEVRAPDPFVVAALDTLASHGPLNGLRAVDLACGTGRHAVELALRGAVVEAWDVSPIALAILGERAASREVSIAIREVDLAGGELPAGAPRFELAVVVDFLDRELLARLHNLLVPGGLAIVTTFTIDHTGAHPAPHYRLERGELLRGLPDLELVHAEEENGRAGAVLRRVGK